MQQIYW